MFWSYLVKYIITKLLSVQIQYIMIKILLLSLCQVCLTHTTTVDSPLRTLFEVWMKCIYYQPCMYVQRTDRDLFESGTSIKFSWWRLRWDLYYIYYRVLVMHSHIPILFSNLCFISFFLRSWILDLQFLLRVIIGIKSTYSMKTIF